MSWTHQSALNVDYDSEKELGEDTGFLENFNVAYDHEQAENLSNSESIVMMEDVNNAYAALHEYTGQARFDTLSDYGNSVAGFDLDLRDLDAEQDLIIKLRQQHPDDTRLRTYSQMIADKKPELDALRERSQDVYDRAGVMGTVGTFLGTMGAHVQDPMFMYSLVFGAGPTTAKTALGRAVQVGAKEAAIAGVAEVPVSVSRYQWKEKIESPWTVWDAAEETLMVMTGTGLLSGVGYAIGDALGWTHAAKVARENGLEGEAQILEKRAKKIDEANAHGVEVDELLQAEDEALQKVLTYTDVWHGSPHEFEQPDLSFMGTGEGAQAFGWGFYSAGAKTTAETYQKELGNKIMVGDTTLMERGKLTGQSTGNAELDNYLAANLGDVDKARENIKADMEFVAEGNPEAADEYNVLLSMLDRLEVEQSNEGHLYKLQISDENIDKMLDWDKPLSEQPEIVRRAITTLRIGGDVKTGDDELLHDLFDGDMPAGLMGFFDKSKGSQIYNTIAKQGLPPEKLTKRFSNRDEAVEFFKAEKQRFNDAPMSSGKGNYEPVAKLDGDEFTVETYDQFGKTYGQQAASEYLNSLGIPGIKYLDGDSRADGKGTRNYVVFDEKNITALERNGEPLPVEGKYGVSVEEVLDARAEAESQMGTHSNGNDKSYVSWDIENDPIFDEDGFESVGEDYALIEKIYVPEADRSNGVGRRILRESIHEIQQQHPDMPIKIAAYPFGDNALDMEDLVNFYESEGFDVVNTDGHAVIMEHDGSIVAKPNNVKNTPKESTVIYHGTSEAFDDFDLDKTADGTVWFTDNKALIDSGEVGASGHGQVIERIIDEDKLKLAGWDESDKFSTGELIDQGYDGLKLVEDDQTTYQIFDPAKLSKVGESPSKYNADLEVPGAPILEGSEVTATVRSYAEVMEEFDAEEQLWKDVETCMMGLADGE